MAFQAILAVSILSVIKVGKYCYFLAYIINICDPSPTYGDLFLNSCNLRKAASI